MIDLVLPEPGIDKRKDLDAGLRPRVGLVPLWWLPMNWRWAIFRVKSHCAMSRTKSILKELSDDQLSDIGVARKDIEQVFQSRFGR
ncbi:DUF1127 domain-containing protein [Ochrobactrum sp. CM-21-5]|nr:DUF1127 domain-containing protein [Ochrobactrum sp. CM-21-5]MBC2884968.1 DUF1127 domain-containing protein [Ochrobactrum sp. CM-21-5]